MLRKGVETYVRRAGAMRTEGMDGSGERKKSCLRDSRSRGSRERVIPAPIGRSDFIFTNALTFTMRVIGRVGLDLLSTSARAPASILLANI